jgi:hypothetical protein
MGRIGRGLFEERIAWDRQEGVYLEVFQRLRVPTLSRHQSSSVLR